MLFFQVTSMTNIGLTLLSQRSRVAHSPNWASQAPQLLLFWINIYHKNKRNWGILKRKCGGMHPTLQRDPERRLVKRHLCEIRWQDALYLLDQLTILDWPLFCHLKPSKPTPFKSLSIPSCIWRNCIFFLRKFPTLRVQNVGRINNEGTHTLFV